MGLIKDLFSNKLFRVAVGVGMFMVPGLAMMSKSIALALKAVGANLVLGAVLERSPKSIDQRQQMRSMVRSAVEPQQVLYGRPPKKGGVVVWFETSGVENEYLWHVIAICEHEIDGYEKLWIDDVEIDIATEIDGNGFVTKSDFVDSAGNKLVKAGFLTGQASQTAAPDLVNTFSIWTADHKGNDVAYFWVRLELDRSKGGTNPKAPELNVWADGPPRELAVTVRGKKVYDPRRDSTNGGSGAHRLADPTTWEWSENPVLQRVDYLRSTRFGPGLADDEIDWPLVIIEANTCEELVSLPGAETQQRYQSHGIITVDAVPKSVLESMHSADHGTTVFLADGAHTYTGKWHGPSHEIDETWLSGPASIVSATETDSAYNAVRGRYITDKGQAAEIPPKLAPAYETEDGAGRVFRDIDLPWSTDSYAAQRIAIIDLKKSRQQKTVSLQCNFRAEVVQVWEVVRLFLDEASENGNTYRVIGKAVSQDGNITLSLRQEDPEDWEYTIPELAEPPVIPEVIRNPSSVPAPSGLTAESASESVRLAWTLPDMSSVSHVEVYASATNDFDGASLVTRTASESFIHSLPEGTTRYYWILSRGYNGLVSALHPLSETDGVVGVAGSIGQGPPGEPGDPAIDGFVSVDGPASWVRDQDGSTWNPAATTTDIDWSFSLAGDALARISRRVTRDADGLLTVSTTTHPLGDLNTSRVTITVTGDGTRAVTVLAEYDHEGRVKAAAQSISATLSGADGEAGLSVAEIYAYRRSATAPTTPTGGSYSFTTQTLTPPANWSASIPAGTDPVYISVTVAAIVGTTGDDNSLTWSTPVKVFADGAPGAPGASSVVGILTNEAHTVQAASNGTGYDLTSAGGGFKVWFGTTDVTASSTYSVSGSATKNGLTIAINASTGTYSLSGASWTSDSESFTLQAVYGGVTITRQYSISKSKQGLPGSEGANAPLLRLNATSQQFKYDAAGAANPTSQTITFTAVLQNLAGTATFTATRYNTSGASLGTVTLGGSGNTRTLTNTQFSDAAYCVVSATLSGLTDYITVVRTADGDSGDDGQAVDMVFKRSATQPATPSPSSGVPATWYTDVNSVPAGADPLWASVGTRPNALTNWTWQTPVKVEGEDGEPGLSHSITLSEYGVPCDASGNPKSGAFTSAVGQWQILSGTTDITASATYAIIAQSNVTAQINNSTNQNFTGAKGAYRLTALSAATGYFDMTATYNGATVQRRFTARKVLDGTPASFLSTNTVLGLTSTQTTYIARSGPLQIAVGPSGTMTASFAGDYRGHNAPGSFSLIGKIQYREVGAPTWVDFGAEVTAQNPSTYADLERLPGWISISQTLAGPVSQQVYEFQLLLRKDTTAGGDVTWDTSPTPPRFAVGWTA